MMSRLLGMLIIGMSVLVLSCGKEMQDAADALRNVESIAESAGDAKKTMDDLEQRRKEREESGDTVAMPTDKLLTFLPGSIKGYEAQEPTFETVETTGMSMTTVKREYNGADGKEVVVSLTDYNASAFGYLGVSAVFSLDIRVENQNEISGTFDTGNELVKGFENYKKKGREATATYGIAGRFLLVLSATDQESTDFVRSVAKSMPLKKLASM